MNGGGSRRRTNGSEFIKEKEPLLKTILVMKVNQERRKRLIRRATNEAFLPSLNLPYKVLFFFFSHRILL
jgi:hypothetical protein